MRKIDYAKLAETINVQMTAAKRAHAAAANIFDLARAQCQIDTLTHLAGTLSIRLSVDRAEFLRACGVM